MKTYEFTLKDLLADKEKIVTTTSPIYHVKSVHFENISFKYNDKPVLKNVNIEITPGDFIGVSDDC